MHTCDVAVYSLFAPARLREIGVSILLDEFRPRCQYKCACLHARRLRGTCDRWEQIVRRNDFSTVRPRRDRAVDYTSFSQFQFESEYMGPANLILESNVARRHTLEYAVLREPGIVEQCLKLIADLNPHYAIGLHM
jgi:hypothetical protein